MSPRQLSTANSAEKFCWVYTSTAPGNDYSPRPLRAAGLQAVPPIEDLFVVGRVPTWNVASLTRRPGAGASCVRFGRPEETSNWHLVKRFCFTLSLV